MLLQLESEKLASGETVLQSQLQQIVRGLRIIESANPELVCTLIIDEKKEENT